uniref:DUF1376 domain-containing protein n=1 Tax=Soboliphyme baturini TaxID=241478 RepID=A0A183JAV3_9BILA
LIFRFWYENPGVFTRAQRAEIEKVSLSRILCDNLAGLTRAPPDGFDVMTDANSVPCSQIPHVDLNAWRE